MRKHWKTSLGILAILGALLAGGSYWISGTPQYTLYRLKRACIERDFATFQELVDAERIADESGKSAVEGVVANAAITAAASGTRTGMSGIEQGIFTLMEPTLRARIKQQVSDTFRAGVESGAFLAEYKRFTIRSMRVSGSIADVTITGHSPLVFDKLGCEVQLKLAKMPSRRWRVIEIGKMSQVAFSAGLKGDRRDETEESLSSRITGNPKCMVTAAKYNDTALIASLKKENTDPTVALILAAEKGEAEAARVLLLNGANVNGAVKLPHEYCVGCETPLLAAVGAVVGDDKLVSQNNLIMQLLTNGADVNLKDSNGGTPLMQAAFRGNLNIVRALLDRGSDVNAKNIVGYTALMYACEYGPYPDVVELLLTKGANPNEKDITGRTAFSYVTDPTAPFTWGLGEKVDYEKVNATVAALKRGGAR